VQGGTGERMTSNKEATISTIENRLSLSSFVRYPDDSSVKFCINVRSHFFEIKDFKFYSDIGLFNFL